MIKNNISYDIDELGNYCHFEIDSNIYSKLAILKTAYWFTENNYIQIKIVEENYIVELRVKDTSNENNNEIICRDFINKIIDFELRQKIINETQSVRDLIIKKAFGEIVKTKEPILNTSEEHLPNFSDSFKNDPNKISKIV